jgi:response regulator RpfG family c-di-GMP phosphodiesterase
MSNPISFLVIDDEQAVVISLETLIDKNFSDSKIYTAYDGNDGWDQVQRFHPHIVISDLNMPGLDGLKLLKKIRGSDDYNDVYFIILASNTEQAIRLKALDEGADDFIIKPFFVDEITAKLRSASRYVELKELEHEENKLIQELANELERSFQDMTLFAVKFIQARIPASTEMLKRVADAAYWIAHQFGGFETDQLQDLRTASFLCYIGKICLPDDLLHVPLMIDGRPSNKLMFQVPVTAKEIVSSVPHFKDVANILYHIYENFDGSGFPERLQSWQIPLASRIIRVALDYGELNTQNMKSQDSIERIKQSANRLYDPKITTLMDQFLATSGTVERTTNERPVQLHELEEGMVLSRDIVTSNGLKLIPAGSVLQEHLIKRIFSHNSTDPILGQIFVKVG